MGRLDPLRRAVIFRDRAFSLAKNLFPFIFVVFFG
jgi:hypothetical protein